MARKRNAEGAATTTVERALTTYVVFRRVTGEPGVVEGLQTWEIVGMAEGRTRDDACKAAANNEAGTYKGVPVSSWRKDSFVVFLPEEPTIKTKVVADE